MVAPYVAKHALALHFRHYGKEVCFYACLMKVPNRLEDELVSFKKKQLLWPCHDVQQVKILEQARDDAPLARFVHRNRFPHRYDILISFDACFHKQDSGEGSKTLLIFLSSLVPFWSRFDRDIFVTTSLVRCFHFL